VSRLRAPAGVRVRPLERANALALSALVAAVAALGGSLVAACEPAASPGAPPIASLHASRCGKCHAPPEPGSHTRAQLEGVFGRHRGRARLSPEEWSAMVDYLAAPEGAMAKQKD
jgi:hypothetical protein